MKTKAPRVVCVPGRVTADGTESTAVWCIIGHPGTFPTFIEAQAALAKLTKAPR